jgi:hypothetical protein
MNFLRDTIDTILAIAMLAFAQNYISPEYRTYQ